MQPHVQQEYEKKFRTCRMNSCLKRGYWQPWLYFSAGGEQYRCLKLLKYLFCDDHMKEFGLEDFISGKGIVGEDIWTNIEKSFVAAGRPVPLKELTLLEWRNA